MLSLSSIAIEEKNKLVSDSVWLVCLKIVIPGEGNPIFVVRNNEDLTWNYGSNPDPYIWQAFPFELDEVGDTSKGEIPKVTVKISNISRAMEFYVQQYDTYCKTYGYSPIDVYIYVVNTKVIADDVTAAPEVEHQFELVQPTMDAKWATFDLGAANPFNRRFPQGRLLKNFCRWRAFKGSRCGYIGAATSCDRTLTQCRDYGNSERFGGFPGAGFGGIHVNTES